MLDGSNTDLLKKYNELKQAIEFYEELFDKSPVMLYINNAKEIKQYWKSQKNFLGYDEEYYKSRNEKNYADIYYEDDKSLYNDIVRQNKEISDKIISGIYRVYNKEREIRWIYSISTTFKYDKDHNPEFSLCAAFDITDRIHSDESLSTLLKENYQLKNQLIISKLTKREKEIIKLFAAGKTQKEISEIMNISLNTVNTHRKNIFKKIGVTKLSELVKFAYDTDMK